ncbi:hypothetical protein Barb4_03710 [Bacteroidales bacterium Barb4]|nr:hypothetical protein Barb4_03710 [Bacteroidales bacterium Barb4]
MNDTESRYKPFLNSSFAQAWISRLFELTSITGETETVVVSNMNFTFRFSTSRKSTCSG